MRVKTALITYTINFRKRAPHLFLDGVVMSRGDLRMGDRGKCACMSGWEALKQKWCGEASEGKEGEGHDVWSVREHLLVTYLPWEEGKERQQKISSSEK